MNYILSTEAECKECGFTTRDIALLTNDGKRKLAITR